MYFFRVFLVLVSCLFVNSSLADSFKVKDCDANAAADVTEAYRFVANNLNKVFNPMGFLTSKQREEMKNKWGKLTVDCIDDKNKCVNTGALLGRAHGGVGNQVNICYYNHVDLESSLCELVGSMVHEEGHANGIPIMKDHNKPTATVFNNDLVYRMGDVAEAFCEAEALAGRFSDNALRGKSRLAMGRHCDKDDQCVTGKCEKGECVCKEDNDCTNGQKCKKPLYGINQCRP